MPFFKFRQRGQPQPERHASGDGMAISGAQETIDGLRRRARNRLIGAAVLVLAAVVGFPLLFDAQPRPVAVSAPITIPDKNKAPPLRPADAASLGARDRIVPASAPAATVHPPVNPASQAVAQAPASRPVDNQTQRRNEAEAQARAKREADAAKAQAKRDADAKAQAQREAAAKARHDADAKAQTRRDAAAKAQAKRDADAKARRQDAERARALLEGRDPAPDAPHAAASSDKGHFVVQLGAFASADKVHEVRQQAEHAGVKTYVQTVDTKAGKRTRVRAGPFASRAEADKAAAALKKAGLSGAVASP